MARALERVTMYYEGNPANLDPDLAYLTYSVVDGAARKDNVVYEVPSPSFASESPNAIWTAAVTAIKAAEGIA